MRRRDLTAAFHDQQMSVLERVASGESLPVVLDAVVGLVEAQGEGMLCTILLVDAAEGVVRSGATRSVPAEYARAIDGARIGPNAGSCGTAAYLKRRVFVDDIATHRYWADYKHLALAHGLVACWSTPIKSADNEVLGTFAMYYRVKRRPTPIEMSWVDAATRIASIAILRSRDEETLRGSEAKYRRLARIYGVSNRVNEAIVHLREPGALYDFACSVAVEEGLARLAWIGLAGRGSSEPHGPRLTAVAKCGADKGYVDLVISSLLDPSYPEGPAAASMRTGRHSVTNDVAAAPEFHWKAAAIERGFASCAVFPLRAEGKTIGVFALYAERPGAFGDEECAVLSALADDIAFGVEAADVSRERQRLVADLAERVKELTMLHQLTALLQTGRPVDRELLQEAVALFPGAWRFTDLCEARIVVGDCDVRTTGWRESPQMLRATFALRDAVGAIEVVYTEPRGPAGEDPFLPEEKLLIRSAADVLAAHAGRMRAGDALRKSEERLRAVIEHTPNVAIQWFDAEGRVLFANQASARLFGWDLTAAIGRRLGEMNFPMSDAIEFERALTKVFATGLPEGPLEFQFRRADGADGVLLSTIFRIPYSESDYCGVCMDVDLTEHRALERQLQQSQRLQAIGTLAGGIAHDFNNILTAIRGHTDLALMTGVADDDTRESLEEIGKASRRAADLVKRILTFSRDEPPRREVVALSDIASEAVELLRATVPGGVSVRASASPGVPLIFADGTQLHQIVMNLGTNGIHAMRERGGVLAVDADACEVDNEAAARIGIPAGHYARLCVTDEGTGMDSATLARVFEPFFTTKPKGEGTGLGLSVVHGIVKNHGGAVVIDSEPGRGTIFTLYFPAHHEPRAGTNVGTVESQARQELSSRQIMYVDHDEALVTLVKRMLQRQGYRVVGHSNARTALDDLRARSAGFAAVIADMSMPGGSGIEFAREAVAVCPGVAVVLVSGHVNPSENEMARSLGFGDVLLKPQTASEFAKILGVRMHPRQ
jgi:PAS domain S-box-containing protein